MAKPPAQFPRNRFVATVVGRHARHHFGRTLREAMSQAMECAQEGDTVVWAKYVREPEWGGRIVNGRVERRPRRR